MTELAAPAGVAGTYEQLHAGDHILGYDGDRWGVAAIAHHPRLVVALVKPGHRVTGYPPEGTEVTILHRADVSAERSAVGMMMAGGLGRIEVLSEEWLTS